DGGYKRASLPTGRNAADFVDWKFAKDYDETSVRLDAMLSSHCDADHYGGLWDLLNPAQRSELDCKTVSVEAFYHAGVGWWKDNSANKRWLGNTTPDGKFLLQLMEDRDQILRALPKNANPALQGEWSKFMEAVTNTTDAAGNPTPCHRLSHADHILPGFDGSAGSDFKKVRVVFGDRCNGTSVMRRERGWCERGTGAATHCWLICCRTSGDGELTLGCGGLEVITRFRCHFGGGGRRIRLPGVSCYGCQVS
ncbi:hypothetical protein E3A20_19770, partial [Planctomyces bekefii]